MKYLLLPLIMLSVSGCDPFRMIAPRTVSGFQSGGILGALDGATGAILARCKTLDGVTVRVAVDGLADLAGQSDRLGQVRDLRETACENASRVNAVLTE
ncbi:MAG: hypothetical protein AAF557_19100 [Pseudomonadota bacterium]